MGSEASFVVNTMYNDKTIMGCRYGSARPQYDIPLMVRLYQAGRLKLDELVTRPTRSRTFTEALDELHDGKLARGVLDAEAATDMPLPDELAELAAARLATGAAGATTTSWAAATC